MLGLTQAGLARLAGLSTTGLNNIESGQSDPKVSTMEAVRRGIRISWRCIRKWNDRPEALSGRRPGKISGRPRPRSHVMARRRRIIEVESFPILQGPVPRVRARFKGTEPTAWTMPSEFEFAAEPEPGLQTHVR
jgi:transcriptional regulator with XRE-family HTH domain